MHGMRAPNQTPAQARQLTDQFITDQVNDAAKKWCEGDERGALQALGRGLHAVMDSASPAHRDAQGNPLPWKGVEGMAGNVIRNGAVGAVMEGWDTHTHAQQETLEVLNNNPTLRTRITEAMRDLYKRFLGELKKLTNCKGCAEKAARMIEPPPPPAPVDPNVRPRNTDEIRRLTEQINGRPG